MAVRGRVGGRRWDNGRYTLPTLFGSADLSLPMQGREDAPLTLPPARAP